MPRFSHSLALTWTVGCNAVIRASRQDEALADDEPRGSLALRIELIRLELTSWNSSG